MTIITFIGLFVLTAQNLGYKILMPTFPGHDSIIAWPAAPAPENPVHRDGTLDFATRGWKSKRRSSIRTPVLTDPNPLPFCCHFRGRFGAISWFSGVSRFGVEASEKLQRRREF